MPATFIPNLGFIRSGEVHALVGALGEAVVDRAKEIAPKRTGHLADSIEGHWEGGVFRVTAHDFKGGWLEFGTARTPAEPYLGPAAVLVVGNLH